MEFNTMEEENMKGIYRVIPVIVIFCLLCGCSDINSDYNVDEDDEEIEIIKQETLFLEDTDYGPVNISYVLEYHGTGRNKDKYLNISIQLLDRPEKLHTVNMVHWIEGGMGGGLSYDPINEIYYRSSMFDNNFIDFWILFYEKGSEIWDANNGTTSNELVLKKTMSFFRVKSSCFKFGIIFFNISNLSLFQQFIPLIHFNTQGVQSFYDLFCICYSQRPISL